MNRHIIRTSETDSVKGNPSKQKIDVVLNQTTKTLPFPNISTTLSQRSVYEEERQNGNKFRLIVTIVPYCSNVLFNPLTEIVKDEGSENPTVVTDCVNMDNAPIKNVLNITDAYGECYPTRVHMISNTEYSSEKHGGYKYHPGYDFFDNHILRNNAFKLVNTNKKSTDREVFNTLGDYARDRNGEYLKYSKRLSILSTSDQVFGKQHLYLADDILKIDESINQNLHEENGWWGFLNNSTIDAKELNGTTRLWDTIDISRVLNDSKSCEFIDMYPDRTLFSFSPKYNEFRHTQEYNWNVVVTYPYKNIYSHPICLGGSSYIRRRLNSEGEYVDESISEGNRWMGLKVMSVNLGQGKIGGNSVVFRTYTKHGLSQQDLVYIYYTNPFKETEEYCECEKFSENSLNGSEKYYESENYYKVTNVGDLNRENDEYYFYISNVGLLKELYRSYMDYVHKLEKKYGEEANGKIPFFNEYKKYKDAEDLKDIFDENNVLKSDLINKILRYTNFRIRRCVNGIKSTYYLRLFRKVPNLRAAQREITEEESQHRSKFNGVFENYIKENALDPNNSEYQRLINNEQYKMAFASNIFNDNITQISFMDGIDTKGLCDNLGRPLSELYYTIVKNNAGHEAWYREDEEVSGVPMYSTEDVRRNNEFIKKYGQDYTVEFSHCFGSVTSGLEMYFKKSDNEDNTVPEDYLKKLSSANHISNIINNDVKGICVDEVSNNLDENIKYKDTFFHGDLVEYNPFECEEHILSNVMHRFNTAQRELIENPLYSQYQYHEITEDDYDLYDFEVTEFSAVNGIIESKGSNIIKEWKARYNDYKTIARPEGYIYKAHYKIPIREFTRLLQDSHYSLNIRSVKPVQKDGILLQVKTKLAHNLEPNEIIFICDDERDTRYITKCVNVIDKLTFLMSVDYSEIVVNATDFEDIEFIKNYNNTVYNTEHKGEKNKDKYIKRFSWLELCEILNGKFDDDISYPKLVLRRKNKDIPDYASYIGGNNYVWRNIINIGDSFARDIPDYIFANGYFYVTNRINFYLKRQDPFGNNGLYFDGEDKYPYFPNDPYGTIQKENNYVTKDTNTIC